MGMWLTNPLLILTYKDITDSLIDDEYEIPTHFYLDSGSNDDYPEWFNSKPSPLTSSDSLYQPQYTVE